MPRIVAIAVWLRGLGVVEMSHLKETRLEGPQGFHGLFWRHLRAETKVMRDNPYQAPAVSDSLTEGVHDQVPAVAVKKATNLIRDARQSVMVGLIPILGLIFILRLVQWYLLRRRIPVLATADS